MLISPFSQDQESAILEIKQKHQDEISNMNLTMEQAIASRESSAEELFKFKSLLMAKTNEIENLQKNLEASEEQMLEERSRHKDEGERFIAESFELRRRDQVEAQRVVEEIKGQAERTISSLKSQHASEVEAIQYEVNSERRSKEDVKMKAEAQASAMQQQIKWLESQLADRDRELKLGKERILQVESELVEHKKTSIEAEKMTQLYQMRFRSLDMSHLRLHQSSTLRSKGRMTCRQIKISCKQS